MTSLLLAVLALTPDAGTIDAGAIDAGTPPWTMADKLGAGKSERAALIADLTRDGGGVGESALTKAEAEALLDDPRAQLVYSEKTISIVAPSMVQRHRQEHIDLMARFLQPERVAAGVAFRKEKDAVLTATQTKTGVEPEVIIGILMWESKLGTITGDYVAFNALASQAFFTSEANDIALYRERLKPSEKQTGRVETIRARGRKNLVALIRQCKSRGIDVLTVKGSWAGALGFPQFMPASLRWAEDGNGDGKIDLFEMDDAIASVGKYLQAAHFKKSARDAVYDYNHEAAYVEGVLAFAKAVKCGISDAGSCFPEDAGTH